jgi:hypothetical protein
MEKEKNSKTASIYDYLCGGGPSDLWICGKNIKTSPFFEWFGKNAGIKTSPFYCW